MNDYLDGHLDGLMKSNCQVTQSSFVYDKKKCRYVSKFEYLSSIIVFFIGRNDSTCHGSTWKWFFNFNFLDLVSIFSFYNSELFLIN